MDGAKDAEQGPKSSVNLGPLPFARCEGDRENRLGLRGKSWRGERMIPARGSALPELQRRTLETQAQLIPICCLATASWVVPQRSYPVVGTVSRGPLVTSPFAAEGSGFPENRSVALRDPVTQMNQKPLWWELPPLTLEKGIALRD